MRLGKEKGEGREVIGGYVASPKKRKGKKNGANRGKTREIKLGNSKRADRKYQSKATERGRTAPGRDRGRTHPTRARTTSAKVGSTTSTFQDG